MIGAQVNCQGTVEVGSVCAVFRQLVLKMLHVTVLLSPLDSDLAALLHLVRPLAAKLQSGIMS